MDHTDITCSHFIRTMADFLAGELDGDEEKQSRLHVETCPDCASYLRNYEATMGFGRETGSEDAANARMPDELVRDILAARRRMN